MHHTHDDRKSEVREQPGPSQAATLIEDATHFEFPQDVGPGRERLVGMWPLQPLGTDDSCSCGRRPDLSGSCSAGCAAPL